jgi:hypothetical protein
VLAQQVRHPGGGGFCCRLAAMAVKHRHQGTAGAQLWEGAGDAAVLLPGAGALGLHDNNNSNSNNNSSSSSGRSLPVRNTIHRPLVAAANNAQTAVIPAGKDGDTRLL